MNTVSQTVSFAQGIGFEGFGCLKGKHNGDVRLTTKLGQSAIGTLRRYIKGMDLVQFPVVASRTGIGQQKQGNRAGGSILRSRPSASLEADSWLAHFRHK